MRFDQYCYCVEDILRFREFSKNEKWTISKSVKFLFFFSEQNKNQIQFYKFVVYHSCIAMCIASPSWGTEKQHSRAEEGSERGSRDDWRSSFSRTTCISQLPLSSVSSHECSGCSVSETSKQSFSLPQLSADLPFCVSLCLLKQYLKMWFSYLLKHFSCTLDHNAFPEDPASVLSM